MTKSGRPLGVGLYLPVREAQGTGHPADINRGWRELRDLALLAEATGFDSVWIPDHLLFRWPGNPVPQGTWEGWSLLSALAAVTTSIELGTLVACTSFRNPALLAKMADTVDEISGGRLTLGLGAGYHEPEFTAFGLPFTDRASRFEEAVTIISRLLRTGSCDFSGKAYTVRECELRPRGPRSVGPPIMIATSNPAGIARPRMHRLLATHADIWNGWLAFWRSWPDSVPPLRERIDHECERIGRDPATLARTVTILVDLPEFGPMPNAPQTDPLRGTPEQIAEALAGFAAEGIAHVQVQLNPTSSATVEWFGRVLEALDRP